eukprot:COSAG01_NODE_9745_length_2355_cov_12.505319_1_plen_87_part_00
MWVQFYVIDRKCALMPALTAVFVDQKYELETWLRTQDRGAREKAADIRGMVLDRDRDCAAKIVRDILLISRNLTTTKGCDRTQCTV